MSTQSGFKEGFYTPGGAKIPAAVIKRDDPEVREIYRSLQARRAELSARGAAIETEIAGILEAQGAAIAEARDWRKHTDQLDDLRAEADALEFGVKFLSDKLELMKRLNTWL